MAPVATDLAARLMTGSTCTSRAKPRSAHESGNSRTNREEVPRRWSDSLQLRPGGVKRFAPGGGAIWLTRLGPNHPHPRGSCPRLARLHCPRPEPPLGSGRVRHRGTLMAAGGGEPVFRSPRRQSSTSWNRRSNQASSRGHTSHPRDVARRWSCPHNSSTAPASVGCRQG